MLESEVALADEPRPFTGFDSEPALTLTPLDQEAPAPRTAPPGFARVVAPLLAVPARALAPGSVPTPSAPPFVRADEQAPPVRLDAASILSLKELLLDPEPWHAAFPGYEASIRKLELYAEVPARETDPIDPKAFSASAPTAGAGWLAQHIEINLDDGIVYKENFTWRGMNLRLKIWGPVLDDDAGLGVRLRGLQLSGYPVELRARATTDLQDVQIKIAF